ncbi:hypothetical protein FP2506_07756 [Fulvimarina pelagi HTCC2506]|uniref:Uncharacterized protein n=1 Tax=Fulvimarina pelagi HTCC2506 TaxID=314231 RepID=Q0G6J5_9HYPH|nr:hypothetical protein FP2506_07756 [Fulvimarina pelagi HTCC2506]
MAFCGERRWPIGKMAAIENMDSQRRRHRAGIRAKWNASKWPENDHDPEANRDRILA